MVDFQNSKFICQLIRHQNRLYIVLCVHSYIIPQVYSHLNYVWAQGVGIIYDYTPIWLREQLQGIKILKKLIACDIQSNL